jgi:hypothetical protein
VAISLTGLILGWLAEIPAAWPTTPPQLVYGANGLPYGSGRGLSSIGYSPYDGWL